MSLKLPFQLIFYCKFDEVAFPVVSTIKTCFNMREWFSLSWFHSIIVSRMGSWVSKLLLLLCFLYCKNDCIDSKNVWFLGGRYYLHFSMHSLLCVRLSGSSDYRRGTCGHLGLIYVQRGRASKFWRSRGREARNISFQIFFLLPPKLSPFPFPLSWFETYPRWPPVTQYAIVGLACEQSSYYHDYTLPEMHREREFLGKTIQSGSSRSVRNSCDRRNM